MEFADKHHLLSVDEVEARVTARDMARWVAFYKIKSEEREEEKRKSEAKAKGRR